MSKRQLVQRIAVATQSPPAESGEVSPGAATAALTGMAAAWVAAGSVGLMAQPLRNGLLGIALAGMLVAAWPKGRYWVDWALLALATAAALVLAVPAMPACGVLGVALVTAVLARLHAGTDRRVLSLVAAAVVVLGIYRLALVSLPTVWSISQMLGQGLGQLAAAISGKPLRIGATFAGLEVLVPLVVLYAGWLRWTAPPRRGRAIYAAVAIVVVHLGYLLLLASATDLMSLVPAPSAAPQDPFLDKSVFNSPPDWQWRLALGMMLPWNLPIVAVVLDLVVLGLMFRWSAWLPADEIPSTPAAMLGRLDPLVKFGPPVLALLLPLLVIFSPNEAGLDKRKIVAYDQGYLDWEKPVFDAYGRDSAGMYGMLPLFVETLGGELVHSAELASEDLRDADVLLLLHPDQQWSQDRLERVWQFVRDGGSLLLVTGRGIPEDPLGEAVNEVLQPTAIEVRIDTAVCPIPSWQHSLDVMSHPATTGIDDRHNRFGFLLGSTIRAGWPARPLLVGRYGWSEPGYDTMMSLDARFDAGESLGDVVLAAEQPLGRGTVVVLADPYCLTNEGNADAFPFTGRLLSYLADRSGTRPSGWRQALGVLLSALVIGLVLWRPDPSQAALVAVVLGMSLAGMSSLSGGLHAVLPDGRDQKPNPVAYIDASHLEAYSQVNWGLDDLAGWKLTLMRNGYLPLMAPDLSPERLGRASLLISIGPARAFSEAERGAVRQFVESGGIFMSMVGAPEAGPSEALLADFGFRVPPATLPAIAGQDAPHYERHFRTRYLDAKITGGYDCFVGFDSAWPIECSGPDTAVVAWDFDTRPLLAVRAIGQGKVVVIGDTGFAMNKNLEDVAGRPVGGGYENAHFWRWFFTYLNGPTPWIPPKPPGEEASQSPESTPAGESPTGQEVSP